MHRLRATDNFELFMARILPDEAQFLRGDLGSQKGFEGVFIEAEKNCGSADRTREVSAALWATAKRGTRSGFEKWLNGLGYRQRRLAGCRILELGAYRT